MNNYIGKILTNRNGHEYLLLAYNEKEDKMLLQKIGYNSFVVCYGLKSLAEMVVGLTEIISKTTELIQIPCKELLITFILKKHLLVD